MHYAQSFQLDLKPLEHESRNLFILGLLFGVILHVLAAFFISYESLGTFERHITEPFIVELITLPRLDLGPYVARRPSNTPPPLVQVPATDPVLPGIQTSRPGEFALEPNTITSIIDADARDTAWGQAAKILHDSLLTFDYLFKRPDTAIPIRNHLFVDTGGMKTRIVFDPNRKQAIEGYAHYGVMWTMGLEPPDTAMLSIQNLAGEVTRLTNIEFIYDYRVDLMPYLPKETARAYNPYMAGYSNILSEYTAGNELAKDYSLIFMPVDRIFELEQEEYYNVFTKNRFILVDNAGASYDDGRIDACIRRFGYIGEGIGYIKIREEVEMILLIEFRALPRHHPVYHSFYDFDGPPPSTEAPDREGMDTIYGIYFYVILPSGQYIPKRMIGIYTPQGYTRSWADSLNTEQIKMGVNLVTFAMAQYDTEYDMDTGEWYLTSDKRFLEK